MQPELQLRLAKPAISADDISRLIATLTSRGWTTARELTELTGYDDELVDWFCDTHGLPFIGILFKWEPVSG